jgi:hypothetical protein
MESFIAAAETVVRTALILGCKLGLVGMFALPCVYLVSRLMGDRVFNIYAKATTAPVGLMIGAVAGQICIRLYQLG